MHCHSVLRCGRVRLILQEIATLKVMQLFSLKEERKHMNKILNKLNKRCHFYVQISSISLVEVSEKLCTAIALVQPTLNSETLEKKKKKLEDEHKMGCPSKLDNLQLHFSVCRTKLHLSLSLSHNLHML